MSNPNEAFINKNNKNKWGNSPGVPISLIFTRPKVLNLQCCTAGCGNELNMSMAKGDTIVLNDTICSACDGHYWEWFASDVLTNNL